MASNDSGRRAHPRVKARLKVRFHNARAFISEYTQNISHGGMFVRTHKPCAAGERVEVILVLPGSDEEVSVFGEVVRVVTAEAADEAQPAGMGLKVLELDPETRREIEEFIEAEILARGDDGPNGRRKHPRVEARLRVRFGTKQALVEEYIHNISHGGIFIQTPTPRQLNERLWIILLHPSTGEEIQLHGEVVRLVTAEEAHATGQKTGMGVRFLELEEYTLKQLDAFINSDLARTPSNAQAEE